MNMGKREILFLLVLAAVPLSAWFFVFQPRNEDIRESRAEINAMQATLTQLNDLNRSVGDLGEAISNAELRLSRFRENIPDAEEVDDLLSEIDAIGVRNHLDVKSVRTLTQVDVDGYSELPLSLKIEGHFAGVYQFLVDLETLSRITRVREFEIKRNLVDKDAQKSLEESVAMDLTLVIYFEEEQIAEDMAGMGEMN